MSVSFTHGDTIVRNRVGTLPDPVRSGKRRWTYDGALFVLGWVSGAASVAAWWLA